MAKTLRVEVIGDTRGLEKAFSKTAGSSSKLGSALGKTLRAGALVGGAALAGVGLAAKMGFSELVEAQKVTAQTGAVLKSTGGAANVTARQITDLAGSLSKMSGVDDEVIQSGSNLLATFTRIRNEVGKGNDIFNQATKATLNLSVAMGKDMSSSAILVGKALNDPVKGMTALTRAGIQFTEAQKKSIKAMVASGDTMGAQKLILAELTTQFGGSARAAGDTLGGQLNKLRNRFDEFAAGVVGRVIPVLTGFANQVIPPVTDALGRLAGFLMDRITPAIDAVVNAMPRIIQAFRDHQGVVAETVVALQRFGSIMDGIVSKNFGAIEASSPRLVSAFGNLATSIRNLSGLIKGVAMVVFFGMYTFWNFTLPAAIRAAAFALDKISVVVKAVSGVIKSALAPIPGVVSGVASAFGRFGSSVGSGLQGAIAAVRGFVGNIKGWFEQLIAWVGGLAGRFSGAGRQIGVAIVQGIISGITGLAGAVKDAAVRVVTGALSAAKSKLSIHSPSLVFAEQVGKPIGEGIAKGITDAGPRVDAALRGVLTNAIRAKNIGNVSSIISQLFGSLQGGQTTKSERIIGTIMLRREKEDLAQGVTDAQGSLAAAQEALLRARQEGDPAAIAAAQAVVAAEQRAVKRAMEDVTLFNLRMKAEAERAKLEKAQFVAQIKLTARLDSLQKLFDKNHVTIGALMQAVKGILRSLKIPGFAGGVRNFGGGLAVVGEEGPELVRLPRGSDVYRSGTGPGGGGGAGRPIVFNFPNYVGSRQELSAAMQEAAEVFFRRNGRSMFA